MRHIFFFANYDYMEIVSLFQGSKGEKKMSSNKRHSTKKTASSEASTEKTNTDEAIPVPYQMALNILSEMKVQEYEPKVLDMLSDFIYNHIIKILSEAKINAHHRDSQEISLKDIQFACHEIQQEFDIFNNHLSETNAFMDSMDEAMTINQIPLPFISHHSVKDKISLPKFPIRLTEPNFQIDKTKFEQQIKEEQIHNVPNLGNSTVNLVNPFMQPYTTADVNMSQSQPANPNTVTSQPQAFFPMVPPRSQ
ncbi:hypothetical protein RFI_30616 [Reticulomyxa filosa]|uniref:Transcription initiation factor TFIID subunit 12 domain-containing protein n=1 Tax=Reticulomyxa filosa TaxID=46433 RepID=X6M053_RETFI|nr:hypothetical protein RFI_30616 [Reticulomyxa filosa]|eukprot:ETO06777.1 hypothetical protein RFI_30616 [Reticulomyxa filosa]